MITEEVALELKRKKRVADLMVSAHSVLAHRYKGRGVALDILLMIASLFTAFVSIIGFFRAKVPLLGREVDLNLLAIIGSCAIVIVSLAEWRVDWKGLADRHGEAFREFSLIKGELTRAIANGASAIDDDVRRINERYDYIGNKMEPIPSHQFLALKQKHARKVYVSRLLDKWPFLSSRILLICLQIRQSKKAIRHEA